MGAYRKYYTRFAKHTSRNIDALTALSLAKKTFSKR
jgi:hypothetical protein